MKSVRVFAMAVLSGVLLVSPLENDATAGKTQSNAAAWQSVRTNEPRFAKATIELVSTLLEAGVKREKVLCLTESQVEELRTELCALGIIECSPTPNVPCQTCRPANSNEDIERYLDCMEKRTACLGH
jgi:hypothetical protein